MIFAALLLSLAVSLPAMAQKAEKPSGPCKADAEKLCKDVKPGDGRIKRCLKEHEADLSPECKEKGEELKKRLAEKKEFEAACKEDTDKLCKGAEPGRGLKKCLREHKDELSETCRGFIKEKRKERRELKEALQEACGKDKDQLCKDVEPGGGGIKRCLKEHEGELSDSCKQFMKAKREGKEEKAEGEKKEKGGKGEKKPPQD